MTSAAVCLVLTQGVSIAGAQPKDSSTKSSRIATAMAVAGSLLPVGLVAVGIGMDQPAVTAVGLTASLVTPSIGHFYADGGLTVTTGMRLRGVSLLAGVAGFAVWVAGVCTNRYEPACENGDNKALTYTGIAIAGAGAAMYLTGIIWDVATAGQAAERANQRNGVTLSIAPIVTPQANGGLTGLSLTGTF